MINFLIDNYFFFVIIILILNLLLFLLNIKNFWGFLRNVKTKSWIILGFIVVAAFIFRLTVIPHTHYVYFDEFDHLNIAQNLFYSGKFAMCMQGAHNNCEVYKLQVWPPVYNVLLSLSYHVFGESENTAYIFQVFIGTFTIILIFILAFFLFDKANIALWSAFGLAFLPVHLQYSGNTEPTMTSVFSILLALISSSVFAKKPKTETFFFVLSTTLLAIYSRAENWILLFLIPLFIFSRSQNVKSFVEEIRNKKNIAIFFSIVFLLFAVCLIPCLLQIHYGITSHTPGWDENILKLIENAKKHISSNFLYLLGIYYMNIDCVYYMSDSLLAIVLNLPFTLLPVIGLLRIVIENRKFKIGGMKYEVGDTRHKPRATSHAIRNPQSPVSAIFFIIWLLTFFIGYSLFAYGDFTTSEGSRYTLNLYIALVILSGVAINNLATKNFLWTIIITTIIFLNIAEWLPSLPTEQHKEYTYVLSMQKKLPDNTYIVAYNPSIILSAIHKKSITPDLFENIAAKPKKFIVFKDYWWQRLKKISNKFEYKINRDYNQKILSEINIGTKAQRHKVQSLNSRLQPAAIRHKGTEGSAECGVQNAECKSEIRAPHLRGYPESEIYQHPSPFSLQPLYYSFVEYIKK